MAKQKAPSRSKQSPSRLGRRTRIAIAGGILLLFVLLEIVNPSLLGNLWPFGKTEQSITNPDAPLASFFSPEVLRWQPDIERWADEYQVNPNVIAIVIQIESCGNPTAISGAGALGLMQVMPFHFPNGLNMLNPDTNVSQGMTVFYECLTQYAGWDLGLALACYNGGPSVTQRSFDTWAQETQYYYRWATGLWDDVVKGKDKSATLSEWLNAGGQRLCDSTPST
ncbi:MAG: transglycosylase SLT domain-containing protein [Anaerolineae bacterium]|nr:transglycosylase SLT domain-containing protein [Anaerolineae bacterium]